MKFTTMTQKMAVAILICTCVGTYGYGYSADANTVASANTTVASTPANAVEMPSPIREYKTMDEAISAVGFVPDVPKVMPIGYTMQSITTVSDNLLQILYVNSADKGINYRVALGSDDISGNYNDYRVTATEKVNGNKVTFKGGKKMVYLATWIKDGQTHSLYFESPVTRETAKAVIMGVAEQKYHTKYLTSNFNLKYN